jgi:hypothetical protein
MKELHRFLAPYQSIPHCHPERSHCHPERSHCHPERSEGSMHFACAKKVHRSFAPLRMTSH